MSANTAINSFTSRVGNVDNCILTENELGHLRAVQRLIAGKLDLLEKDVSQLKKNMKALTGQEGELEARRALDDKEQELNAEKTAATGLDHTIGEIVRGSDELQDLVRRIGICEVDINSRLSDLKTLREAKEEKERAYGIAGTATAAVSGVAGLAVVGVGVFATTLISIIGAPAVAGVGLTCIVVATLSGVTTSKTHGAYQQLRGVTKTDLDPIINGARAIPKGLEVRTVGELKKITEYYVEILKIDNPLAFEGKIENVLTTCQAKIPEIQAILTMAESKLKEMDQEKKAIETANSAVEAVTVGSAIIDGFNQGMKIIYPHSPIKDKPA